MKGTVHSILLLTELTLVAVNSSPAFACYTFPSVLPILLRGSLTELTRVKTVRKADLRALKFPSSLIIILHCTLIATTTVVRSASCLLVWVYA